MSETEMPPAIAGAGAPTITPDATGMRPYVGLIVLYVPGEGENFPGNSDGRPALVTAAPGGAPDTLSLTVFDSHGGTTYRSRVASEATWRQAGRDPASPYWRPCESPSAAG